MTILAEELFVLLLDPVTDKALTDPMSRDLVLAGALVVELSLLGVIEVEPGRRGKLSNGKIVQVSESAPTPALLAEALAKALGKSPEQALGSCRKDIAKKVSASLSAAGFLTQIEDKALGIFPRRSWRLTAASPQAALREELAAALLHNGEAASRIAALIGLLHSIKVEHKIFPDADRKELRARAKVISENNWAAAAVKDVINATYASMTAAVLVATTAASV